MIGRALSRKGVTGAANLVDPASVPWSLDWDAWLRGGQGGSVSEAVGVPALLATLLRLGQGVGMAPQKVYTAAPGRRMEARDSWQWRLLHDRPCDGVPPATFFGNLAIQVAGVGYGCVRMWPASSGRVVDLEVLDSTKVKPKVENGLLVFEDSTGAPGSPVVRDASEIIYVPAVSLDGGPVGMSPISVQRVAVQAALRRQRFEHDHYANNARAGVVLQGPADAGPSEVQEYVDLWDMAHQGKPGKTAGIGGGFTVTTMPVSLEDAQFVESNQWTASQFGAVYGIPRAFQNIGDNAPTELDWRFFVTFALGPLTTTIAQSFNANRVLFPESAGLMTEHVTDALLKPDIVKRYEAYKAARQAGWQTSNEIRGLENLPPHPDGDVLQVIPVGGGAAPVA